MACFISSADELGIGIVEREQKPLGMFGSQHDPTLDPGLGQAGHDPHEVEHEFRGRVRDDDHVGVLALGHLLAEFDVDSFGKFVFHHMPYTLL